MQISSNYNTLFSRVSQLYGNTSGTSSQVSTLNSSAGSSGSTDQVDLSDDYLSFQSYLDKVKNGSVTDDDTSKIQDELNASQNMQMQPPPAIQASGTGSSEESNAIGSFLDKVKNGTVTSDDLTNMESVLSKVSSSSADASTVSSTDSSSETSFQNFLDKVKNGTVTSDDLTNMESVLSKVSSSSADASTVSSTDSSSETSFQNFLDKVKNGTVTQDDLTQMQTTLKEMGEGSSNHVHHRHSSDSSDSSGSTSSVGASTVSSTSSSDSTDSLTLESFLDKVKNGTVTDDDLTQMQTELKDMDKNRPSMPPPTMGMMGLTDSSSTSTSGTSSSGSSSDSTDSLTLQSFLDKIKNGTVSSDDLTEMQSLLENWMGTGSSDSSGSNAQVYDL